MKRLARKLSSMFLALVMVFSVTPFSGALLADETDTEAPAVTESKETEKAKETEKPSAETKETKKPAEEPKETEAPKATETPAETAEETEAPKETEAPATETPTETEAPKETEAPAKEPPAETEAPKETEKPAETPKETEAPKEEAPKAPGEKDKQDPKKGPSQVGEIKDATLDQSTGILTWKPIKYKNPDYEWDPEWMSEYLLADTKILISGAYAYDPFDDDYDIDDDNPPAQFSVNLHDLVDDLIRHGDIKKSADGNYVVWLMAEDIAARRFELQNYESGVSGPSKKLGSIKASINEDTGILKWSKYKGVFEYNIFINEYFAWTKKCSISLKDEIDFLIRAGYIHKADIYNIRIVGYNRNGTNIAKWDGTFEYDSDAVEIKIPAKISGVFFENGIMKWDAVENADGYWITVFDGEEELDMFYVKQNQADVNNEIASIVNEIKFEEDVEVDPNNWNLSFMIEAYEYSASDTYSIDGGDEYVFLAESNKTPYTLVVAPNPMSVSGKTATVKYKKLKKKKQTLAASKVINGLGTGRGPKRFTKVSGDKKISINKTTGKITLKKGMKKKTYTIKVKVKALGNCGYEPSGDQTVTIKIKVKK